MGLGQASLWSAKSALAREAQLSAKLEEARRGGASAAATEFDTEQDCY